MSASLREQIESVLPDACENYGGGMDCEDAGRNPFSRYTGLGWCLPCKVRAVLKLYG